MLVYYLQKQNGITDVTVVPIVQTSGLWSLQDWSAEALSEVDVAVVQVNEWGTLYVSPDGAKAWRLTPILQAIVIENIPPVEHAGPRLEERRIEILVTFHLT